MSNSYILSLSIAKLHNDRRSSRTAASTRYSIKDARRGAFVLRAVGGIGNNELYVRCAAKRRALADDVGDDSVRPVKDRTAKALLYERRKPRIMCAAYDDRAQFSARDARQNTLRFSLGGGHVGEIPLDESRERRTVGSVDSNSAAREQRRESRLGKSERSRHDRQRATSGGGRTDRRLRTYEHDVPELAPQVVYAHGGGCVARKHYRLRSTLCHLSAIAAHDARQNSLGQTAVWRMRCVGKIDYFSCPCAFKQFFCNKKSSCAGVCDRDLHTQLYVTNRRQRPPPRSCGHSLRRCSRHHTG